jgi:alcohol dehydrogenase
MNFPAVLGHEPAGEIIAVGKGVTTRKVGDRVGASVLQTACGRCEWCHTSKLLYCDEQKLMMIHQFGSHAEYMVAEANSTVLIPNDLPYDQAAPLMCAGYTVWSGLRAAEPQPGEKVAIVGIGGLGHLAIQYAKAAGFYTIALTKNPEKIKLCADLGADKILHSGKELAREGGADIILSTANSYATAIDALQGLRPEGRLVLMGIADNSDFVIPEKTIFPQMMMKRQRIIGSQQNGKKYLFESLEMARKHNIKVYNEQFSLQDAEQAFKRVATGAARFRVVLMP